MPAFRTPTATLGENLTRHSVEPLAGVCVNETPRIRISKVDGRFLSSHMLQRDQCDALMKSGEPLIRYGWPNPAPGTRLDLMGGGGRAWARR